MIKINLLKRGDEVVSVNDRFIAIKRKSGKVDVYSVDYSNGELIVDPIKIAVIGYGEGTVEKTTEDESTRIIVF